MGKNHTSVKPGQVLNPHGRPKKGETIQEVMAAYLDKAHATQDGKTNRQVFVEKVYHKAVVASDPSAMKLIWNYSDGLPKDSQGDLVGAMLDKATFVISPPEQKKKDE
jgi:hypothetical protein